MAEWQPKIVNGEIRLKDTPSNRSKVKNWLQKKITDHNQFTEGGRPKKPPLPKVYFSDKLQQFRNKAGAGPSDASKFDFTSAASKVKETAVRESRIALANLDPLNAKNYRKWNKLVKGIMHHSGPAAITGELVKKFELLNDPTWTPDMGITSAGKNFLRNLHKRLDVHGGNSLLNFDWYPTDDLHNQAHRIFEAAGIDLQNLDALTNQFKTPDDVYSWAKNTYKPLIDKVTKEVGDFSLRGTGITPGKASWIQRNPGLFREHLQNILKQSKKVTNIPGVKGALEVADVVRKNPVVSTLSTLPVLSAFDVADAVESGVNLWQNDYYDKDEAEIARLRQLSDQYKFVSGSSGVASLTAAAPIAAPTSLVSGGIHLALEHRINRLEKKEKEINLFLNPKYIAGNTHLDEDDPNYGTSEIKANTRGDTRNIFQRTNDAYQAWLNN